MSAAPAVPFPADDAPIKERLRTSFQITRPHLPSPTASPPISFVPGEIEPGADSISW
jgi:hypothetical protein